MFVDTPQGASNVGNISVIPILAILVLLAIKFVLPYIPANIARKKAMVLWGFTYSDYFSF